MANPGSTGKWVEMEKNDENSVIYHIMIIRKKVHMLHKTTHAAYPSGKSTRRSQGKLV